MVDGEEQSQVCGIGGDLQEEVIHLVSVLMGDSLIGWGGRVVHC